MMVYVSGDLFSPLNQRKKYGNIHTRAHFIASKLSLAEINEAKTHNYLMLFIIMCPRLSLFASLPQSLDLEAYLLNFFPQDRQINKGQSMSSLEKKKKTGFVKMHSSFRKCVEL